MIRLLSINVLREYNRFIFEEYDIHQAPEYAILSHTWERGELSYVASQEANAEYTPGYKKISGFIDEAYACGYQWCWIDTCCIDKTSSAELSEAINSMFEWYHGADMCFAYLSDVTSHDTARTGSRGRYESEGEEDEEEEEDEDDDQTDYDQVRTQRVRVRMHPKSQFHRARWFQRGWTLQELIAPGHLVFYASDWRPIGSKSDLSQKIAQKTGISREFLTDSLTFLRCSMGVRAYWCLKMIENRNTSRNEDLAYCLLGLLGFSMESLYGEGRANALRRLQEHIFILAGRESHQFNDSGAQSEMLANVNTRIHRLMQARG